GEGATAGGPCGAPLGTHPATAGDVWLFDPATKTLIAGDLVTLPVPFLDTACPERWAKALDGLAATGFTVLVPGHGEPMVPADFATYRTAFANLLACGASARDKADCVAGWQKDAAPLLAGADAKFVAMLADYYVETALRGDAKQRAALCGVRPRG